MDMRLPLRIEAQNDELRLSLVNDLRAKSFDVLVQPATQLSNAKSGSFAFLELPSDLEILEPVTNYLTKRINLIWSLPEESCLALGVALREALVNAMKHGNHLDPSKRVRITSLASDDEATFTIEDEGNGFRDPPDPLDPSNLFKGSGRGVFLIKSIMDETKYNGRGNSVTMIKKRSNLISQDVLGTPL